MDNAHTSRRTNEFLLRVLAQRLGVDLKQPEVLVPEEGGSAGLKLPDGSLEVRLVNHGDTLNMIEVLGQNSPEIKILRASDGWRAPPGTIYIIQANTQEGSTPGFRIYLGPEGVIPYER